MAAEDAASIHSARLPNRQLLLPQARALRHPHESFRGARLPVSRAAFGGNPRWGIIRGTQIHQLLPSVRIQSPVNRSGLIEEQVVLIGQNVEPLGEGKTRAPKFADDLLL